MDFQSIFGGLISSAIYSLLTFLVALIFLKKPANQNSNESNTGNPIYIQNIEQIINVVSQEENSKKQKKSTANTDESVFQIVSLIVFLVLIVIYSKYNNQIVQFGYISFGFGSVISILILVSVNQQVYFRQLPFEFKLYLIVPIICWFLFLLSVFLIPHPIFTGEYTQQLQTELAKNGFDGIFTKILNIASKNGISFTYLALKIFGLITLLLSLIMNLKLIISFAIKWVIIIKRSGNTDGFIGSAYKRTKIKNIGRYTINILTLHAISILSISGIFIYVFDLLYKSLSKLT